MDSDQTKDLRSLPGRCLALKARRVSRLITRRFDDALRPWGIRSTQMHLLVAVAGCGELTQADLARLLDLERSAVSRNVGPLLDAGWLGRGRAVGKRRPLVITTAGTGLLKQILPAWEGVQQQLELELGPAAGDALGAAGTALRGDAPG